jgi:hypothetical protein
MIRQITESNLQSNFGQLPDSDDLTGTDSNASENQRFWPVSDRFCGSQEPAL